MINGAEPRRERSRPSGETDGDGRWLSAGSPIDTSCRHACKLHAWHVCGGMHKLVFAHTPMRTSSNVGTRTYVPSVESDSCHADSDGRSGERTGEREGERADAQMHRWTDDEGRADGWTDEQTGRRADRRTDGQMDGQTEGWAGE